VLVHFFITNDRHWPAAEKKFCLSSGRDMRASNASFEFYIIKTYI
jgi:hypothetical protein